MVLILLILLDFFFGIVNLKNVKHLKKGKQRINVNSFASQKMVEFLHVRRWEKRNRHDFCWVKHLVCLQFGNIETWYSSKSL